MIRSATTPAAAEDAARRPSGLSGAAEAVVRFEPTTLWQHMVQTNAQQALPAEQADAAVLEQLRTDPDAWQSVCEAALLHYLVNIAREQLGHTVDEAEKRTALRHWRESQGLYTRPPWSNFHRLTSWMTIN
ncbi:MAG: hypothetical protein R3F53_15285 [Gammaproteobacteria bacterium]